MRWIACVFVLACLCTFGTCEVVHESDPSFCVVIRTYRGHADRQTGLPRLLRSLQQQDIPNWQAVILVLDGQPFPELHSIVADANDSRIWVFAEWIGSTYAAKTPEGFWAPHYHGYLYNLTDDAVLACPKDTTWLLVTNGDNEYASEFFSRVQKESLADPSADLIAFDFYSRYQRSTAPQCDRFKALGEQETENPTNHAVPLCKRNRLKWCHTDLGSFVLRYQRFTGERQAFGATSRPGEEFAMEAEHSDGLLAGALRAQGWQAAYIADRCLFSHSPSPQSCAWEGGTWDDRDMMTWQRGGGVCLSQKEEVDWIMANDPNAEMVTIDVSHDGNISSFPSSVPENSGIGSTLQLNCIRRKNYMFPEVWGAAMDWYSELCADDADLPAMEAWRQAQAPNEQDRSVAHSETSHLDL